jgi:hypothetical protein
MCAVNRTCATCSAFDREHLVHHPIYHGQTRAPGMARCKAAPPPWPMVQDTDWCRAWALRPGATVITHEDNGA